VAVGAVGGFELDLLGLVLPDDALGEEGFAGVDGERVPAALWREECFIGEGGREQRSEAVLTVFVAAGGASGEVGDWVVFGAGNAGSARYHLAHCW
jgi:hypothetical protein